MLLFGFVRELGHEPGIGLGGQGAGSNLGSQSGQAVKHLLVGGVEAFTESTGSFAEYIQNAPFPPQKGGEG